MKALRKMKAACGCMELVDIPEPKAARGHVKIKVEYCGICGSDMKFYHWNMRPGLNIPIPVTFGHEYSGTVAEIGEGVEGIAVGDRVVSETPEIYCGKCEQCRTGNILLCSHKRSIGYQTDGAMADYVAIRQELVHKIPDNVSLKEAALCEPAAVAAHAVYDKAAVQPGDTVIVFGPGTIGLLVLQMVKAAGCRAILVGTGRDKRRLAIGRELGADEILSFDEEDIAEKIRELTRGRGADAAFECSGAGAVINQAIVSLKKAGELVIVSLFPNGDIPVSAFNTLVNNEIRITGSYGQRYKGWEKALQLMSSGQLNAGAIETDVFSLEDWEKGFAKAERKEGVKILLKP